MEISTVSSVVGSIAGLVVKILDFSESRKRRSRVDRQEAEEREIREVERRILQQFSSLTGHYGYRMEQLCTRLESPAELVDHALIELKQQGLIHELSGTWYGGPGRLL